MSAEVIAFFLLRKLMLTAMQIGDFGLSRDLQKEEFYLAQKGGKVPVKWTAPEALHYCLYSSASDVWSFGCVLYEIWSLGVKPFSNMTNSEVSTCISIITLKNSFSVSII